MAVLDPVMLTLGTRGIAAHAPCLAEGLEAGGPARDQLVDVGLVAGVPDDRVARAVEHAVQRQRELDDAQVGREVPARLGDVLDQELADLGRESFEL